MFLNTTSLAIGTGLVIGGGLGLYLTKTIDGKAVTILKNSRNEKGWKQTASIVSGYGLLMFGVLMMIGSISAIAAPFGCIIGFVTYPLPPELVSIAISGGLGLLRALAPNFTAKQLNRFADWMNFSALDDVT